MLMLELVHLPVQVKKVLPIERVSLQGLTPLVTQEAEVGTDRLFLRVIQPGPGTRLARRTVLQRVISLYIWWRAGEGRPQIYSGDSLHEPGARADAVATSKKERQSTTYLRYVASPKITPMRVFTKAMSEKNRRPEKTIIDGRSRSRRTADNKNPNVKAVQANTDRSRSNVRVDVDVDEQEALIRDMRRNPEKYQEQ
jgi:hypothetical protein